MRRLAILISIFLAFVILQSYLIPQTFAQQKKKKEVILSTVDIKEDYEILGIVSVRSGEVNLLSVNEKLKEEAKNLGADYVVTLRYFDYGGYIYAYGTAVKIKGTKPEKHAF